MGEITVVNALGNRVKVSSLKHIVVHSGMFHADDVMCYSLIKQVVPDINLIRANNMEDVTHRINSIDLDKTIICDVMNTYYDHHESNSRCREDGTKRAACGLLFEDIKEAIFPTLSSADEFENTIIIPIEDNDNGISFNPLNASIRSFNPTWDNSNPESVQKGFLLASSFLSTVIQNKISYAISEIKAEQYVHDKCNEAERENRNFCILETGLPWMKAATNKNIKYAIIPSNRGGWNVSANALLDINMENVSIPSTASYVDKGLRFVSFNNKEDAIEFALNLS